MPPRRAWTVRLSQTAQAEFRGIVRWTAAKFGKRQARLYEETLTSALAALTAGPSQLGIKARPEIGKGLFTLHVARAGRKGRHFILFRAIESSDAPIVDVIRLLHDSMDLRRPAPPEEGPDPNG
ncbi:MAG TPA: type II toxin-antitoxin system RelE/ParE family toxin [Methylomirabilota bacterium]|nr:type II toxin-antitoxin system RelE/ParE family toxin [Methylomirabilota bacterium]